MPVIVRACFQIHLSLIFCKFLATFLKNFAAVLDILQKILQKNEQKFAEKQRQMNLNTGSNLQISSVIFSEL